MAIELAEASLFIVIGLVVGIAIIFILMQTRVARKAEQLYGSRRQELESQYEQRRIDQDRVIEERKQEQDNLFQQRIQEMDKQKKNLYATEFEKWKAEYELQHQEEVEARIKAEKEKSLNSSRSSLKGKINEQIASLFPEFTSKYVAADARFIGMPIDFIVFKNLHTIAAGNSERKEVEIVFVEVKTGSKGLNPNERAVRAAVENLRVKYDLLKISVDGNGSDQTQEEPVVIEKSSLPPRRNLGRWIKQPAS